jgi:signal transduction histidine kinase
MTSPSSAATVPAYDLPDDVLDALLYSVSHDLRSPLLTLSLSGELIRESVQPDTRALAASSIALDALKHGAQDLERMLHALTAISRARRRPLETRMVPLRMLLGGHVVISDADLERVVIPLDPGPVRELLDRFCGEEPAEIQVERTDTHVIFRIPSRVELPVLERSPLLELASSLQTYAGTVVEELASLQVQLGRQSGMLEVANGAIRVWLPVARGKS